MLEDSANRLDAKGKTHLQRVREAAHRMARLIDDLRELAQVSRTDIRREDVNVTDIVESIAKELRGRDPQRNVELIVAPGLRAEGDPRLIRIALQSLLENAWKFKGKRPRAVIEFGAASANGQNAFFVRDDGAGFDPDHAGGLFAPFQRLHRAAEFPGTGIGLATVQRIVRRHGGRVWAESAPEKGATFYFTL